MKKIIFFLAVLLPISISAQDEEGWKHEGITGINFSQTSFTNWSEGGERTLLPTTFI